MRKTDGFTLIELMVGIVCSTLVTGAIITFMLMGMNTNRSVLDANVNQRNAKIIVSMVENLASEGTISKLEVDGEIEIVDGFPVDKGDRSWVLYGKDGDSSFKLLSYSPSQKIIYGRNDAVLMEGVKASMLSLSKAPLGGCILGFGIQTDDSFYETSVYNRVSEIDAEGIVLDENSFAILDSDNENADNIVIGSNNTNLPSGVVINTDARIAFLKTLTSQYGSTGTIIRNGTVSPVPYSLWYCGGAYPESDPDWNENTPWCAIFISWALAQQNPNNMKYDAENRLPHEAEVYDPSAPNLWKSVQVYYADDDNDYNIIPGDMIFFDWDQKQNFDYDKDDLEHVGVVLYKDTDYVYTIEGNSGSRVALRRYELTSDSIHCYGRFEWTGENFP